MGFLPVGHTHEDIDQVFHDFVQDTTGECKMYYKEWSSDTYWLPSTELSLLPAGL